MNKEMFICICLVLVLICLAIGILAGSTGASIPSENSTKPIFLSFTVSDFMVNALLIAVGIILVMLVVGRKSP